VQEGLLLCLPWVLRVMNAKRACKVKHDPKGRNRASLSNQVPENAFQCASRTWNDSWFGKKARQDALQTIFHLCGNRCMRCTTRNEVRRVDSASDVLAAGGAAAAPLPSGAPSSCAAAAAAVPPGLRPLATIAAPAQNMPVLSHKCNKSGERVPPATSFLTGQLEEKHCGTRRTSNTYCSTVINLRYDTIGQIGLSSWKTYRLGTRDRKP
jgi:hypothetical protein